MIPLTAQTRVYLAREPADFRKQIDGLALQVQELPAMDPFAPHLFAFRNRAGDKLKVLYWHGNGFCLLYKRLERGTFYWPAADSAAYACSLRELHWLLDGLDMTAVPQPRRLTPSRI